MTSITDLWGALGIAILLGSLCGFFPSTRKIRIVVFTATTLLAFIPILFKMIGPVNFLYAFYDVPSIPTICLTPYYWIWRPHPQKPRQNEKDKIYPCINHKTLLVKIIVVLFGVILYASEFNAFTFDVYNLGYSQSLALLVTCTIILLADKKISFIITLSYLAYKIGLYSNFYDSILDVGLWLCLTVTCCSQLVKMSLQKRNTNNAGSNSPTNEKKTSKSLDRKKLTLRR